MDDSLDLIPEPSEASSSTSIPANRTGWDQVKAELSSFRATGGRAVLSDSLRAVTALQRIAFAWAKATSRGAPEPPPGALVALEALPAAVTQIIQALISRCVENVWTRDYACWLSY